MLCSMKFLRECVSCYGTPTASQSEDSLPAPSSGALRRQSRSISRPDWKPSLHAISEDNVATAGPSPKPKHKPRPKSKPNKATNQMSRSASERRSAPRTAAAAFIPRSHSHRATNTYRRDRAYMVVPSFAPTPFMF